MPEKKGRGRPKKGIQDLAEEVKSKKPKAKRKTTLEDIDGTIMPIDSTRPRSSIS